MQQWPCKVARNVGSSGTRANRAARRPLQPEAIAGLIALMILFSGCAAQTDSSDLTGESPSESRIIEPEAVAPAPVDTISVLDDERSLERRLEDASIAARVRMALVQARDLRTFDFEPIVENGRLELRGVVQTPEQRRLAEAVARQVSGVREVMSSVIALEEPLLADESAEGMAEGDASKEAAIPSSRTGPPSADAATPSADAARRSAETGTPHAESATSPEEAATPREETAPPDALSPAQESEVYHTVRSGESLWTISRQHGVSIEQIRRLNNLRSNSIRPGQRLRVK